MEMRTKNTTAGVLFWTPAPARLSPTSDVASEDEWEDEDEEMPAEKDEDFHSQMDENGIIGLNEALEDVDLGQNDADEDGNCNPPWYATALNTEEACPGGLALELSYDLSELQDTPPLYDAMGGSGAVWPEDEELRQLEEEEQRWLKEKNGEGKKKRDELSSRSGSSTTGPQLVESHIAQGDDVKISSTGSYSPELPTLEVNGPSKRCSRNNITPDSVVYASGTLSPFSPSNLLHPISQSISSPRSPVLPHLRHFFSEELADVSAIEAETFPETGFTESLPESRSSRLSHTSKADWSHESEGEELKSRASSKPAAISPEQDMSNTLSTVSIGSIGRSGKSTINRHQRPTPAPRKMKQHSPETTRSKTRSLNKAGSSKSSYQTASPDRGQRTPRESPFKTQAKTISAEGDEARKGPLSYRTPDFSKIEPRVHFPKSGYKPPKSRGSPKKNVESVEPPLVFKSPAEIVREVLLCSTDGLPPLTDSNSPSACGPNSTVPEEFRCPQQATTLIEQLQEDYNRLLTKYAEAENTIDRLRLEAKVNLYSDPPKPGHSVQSGAIQDGSKLMMLNFPQAQRADISSSSVPQNAPGPHQRASPHPPSAASPRPPSAASISSSRSSGLQTGQQVTRTLSEQANKFLWQVQTFEDLLKSRKLKPFEAMTGLTQLVQGLDSLERSYLAVKEEHGLLQHRGAEKSPFDPDRELEGLIFQCGMCVEELKEQVEQMGQDPPTYKAPPHLTPSPVPTEGGESTPPPESPVFPVPEESVGVEVNSASGESDGVEEAAVEDEPLNYKHLLVEEEDFSTLMDHYQSLEELPTLLDGRLEEVFTLFPGAGNGVQPGEDERDGPYQVTGSLEDQNSLPQRQAESDHQDSAPLPTNKKRTSKSHPAPPRVPSSSPRVPSSSPRVPSPSPVLHVHLFSGSRRIEAAKSHSSSLTSLGESASSERRGSKLQPGPRRILSQDRIISPETDSGFVGSESSHRTPAAVPSCLHQRAPASSVSVPQDGSSGKSQAGPVSQQPLPASSPSHRRTSLENSSSGGSQLSNPEHLRGRPRRTSSRERRCTCSSPSSSPPCWASQMPQTRADSGTSEFGLDSEHSHTASDRDDGQNGQFAESTNSQRSYRPSPSPATPPYRHGDPLRVLDSGQVTNRNEAIQNLQAEVTRLKERLEKSLRKTKPLSPVRAPPSAQGNCSHHNNTSTPRIRSRQRWRDGGKGERRERRVEDELEEESTPRPAHRKRSASAPRQRPEPDITTDSERDHATPRPRLSRCIATSPTAPENHYVCSNAVRSRVSSTGKHPGPSVGLSVAGKHPGPSVGVSVAGKHPGPSVGVSVAGKHPGPSVGVSVAGKHPGPSVGVSVAGKHPGLSVGVSVAGKHPGPSVSERADEPDSRGSKATVCLQCCLCHHGHSAWPEDVDNEPVHNSPCSHHFFSLCGQPGESYRTTEPVRRREREQHPSPHRSCQPTECLDGGGGVRAGYLAAPAPPVLGSVPLVHCVPVCPPPLLFYSSPVMKMDSYPQPFCVSVHSGGASTGVRGRHAGRSLSAGEQHSLNSSLDKAIRAARDMKHTSRRMARSLATGLHRTELLSQSCIY